MTIEIRRLGSDDGDQMSDLNRLFGSVFDDSATYELAKPRDKYLRRVLGRDEVIALVAYADNELAGGLVAYVLDKLE